MATGARPGRPRTGAPEQWNGRVHVGTTCDPSLRDGLILAADVRGITLAELLRQVLEAWLAEEERADEQPQREEAGVG